MTKWPAVSYFLHSTQFGIYRIYFIILGNHQTVHVVHTNAYKVTCLPYKYRNFIHFYFIGTAIGKIADGFKTLGKLLPISNSQILTHKQHTMRPAEVGSQEYGSPSQPHLSRGPHIP